MSVAVICIGQSHTIVWTGVERGLVIACFYVEIDIDSINNVGVWWYTGVNTDKTCVKILAVSTKRSYKVVHTL
jgi:hypothetical protein